MGADEVRLDKFLQVTRLVKRRTLAHDLIAQGRVTVDGRSVRPSADVRPGSLIGLRLGGRDLSVRVLAVPERPRVGEPGLFEVVEDRRKGADDGNGGPFPGAG